MEALHSRETIRMLALGLGYRHSPHAPSPAAKSAI
jgi:hypothetical protein